MRSVRTPFSTAAHTRRAACKGIQASPGFSKPQMVLAASFAKLGRIDEAKTAGARLLELQPGFRYTQQFTGGNFESGLAASMGEALRAAGLPE